MVARPDHQLRITVPVVAEVPALTSSRDRLEVLGGHGAFPTTARKQLQPDGAVVAGSARRPECLFLRRNQVQYFLVLREWGDKVPGQHCAGTDSRLTGCRTARAGLGSGCLRRD